MMHVVVNEDVEMRQLTRFSFNRRSTIAAVSCLSSSPAFTAAMIVSMIFGSLSKAPISLVLLSPAMARGFSLSVSYAAMLIG